MSKQGFQGLQLLHFFITESIGESYAVYKLYSIALIIWNREMLNQETPTGPFTILESRDQNIGVIYEIYKSRTTDFEAPKLWRGGSGRVGPQFYWFIANQRFWCRSPSQLFSNPARHFPSWRVTNRDIINSVYQVGSDFYSNFGQN